MLYADGPRPRLFGHRGASGHFPENTLEAFLAALEMDADRLELDVHGTADGEVVVFHDADLDRTTDGTGPIRARTLQEIQALDAGYRFCDADGRFPFRGEGFRIPTLDALLEATPEVPLNIEIKQAAPFIEDAVLAVLDRHGARDRVLLAAEEHSIMIRIREAAPEMLTGSSAEEVFAFYSALQTSERQGSSDQDSSVNGETLADFELAGFALQVPAYHEDIEVVTPAFVDAAHRKGAEVHVWTINDRDEMERLLDLGVDAIMTDFPDLAMAVFGERGLR